MEEKTYKLLGGSGALNIAVGAVVLNRVRSSSFPNTIAGVIYQPYAFTAVSDGQINLTPNATARKAAIAAMNGCDAIIFTAGIGENHIRARKWVCEGLSFFGIKIDDERNNVAGEERKISADDSRIQVWVIPTNEELAIARDTLEIATKK